MHILREMYEKRTGVTKHMRPLNDLVLIEILEQDESRLKRGGIIIPESTVVNHELLKGEVVRRGPTAAEKGISVGAVVLYDKLSAFYNPPEVPGTVVITKAENVICTVED